MLNGILVVTELGHISGMACTGIPHHIIHLLSEVYPGFALRCRVFLIRNVDPPLVEMIPKSDSEATFAEVARIDYDDKIVCT